MSKQNEAITAVYADEDGNILDAPGMRGMGRTGRMNVLLKPEDLIPLPESADLMLLPDRLAVGQSADGETMPISGLAVAAILPAGYTRLYMPAYERAEDAQRLPLYGYTAVVVYRASSTVRPSTRTRTRSGTRSTTTRRNSRSSSSARRRTCPATASSSRSAAAL